MNFTTKIKPISFLLIIIGLTWILMEIGFFKPAVFHNYPQLLYAYIILYIGIIGMFLSILWKK